MINQIMANAMIVGLWLMTGDLIVDGQLRAKISQ